MSLSDPQIPNAGNANPGQGVPSDALVPALSSVGSLSGGLVPHVGTLTPDTGALLKALRRRWLLAITLGLIVGGLFAGATWLFMPQAKDTARIVYHVRAVPPTLLYPNQDQQHVDPTSYQRTQAALVKSRFVLLAALRDPEVANASVLRAEEPNPIETLERLLIVDFTLGPEIMRVSMTGDNEEELKKVLEAVAEAYDQEVLTKEHDERASHLEEYRKVREEAMRNLKRKQDEFSNQVVFADAVDPFSQSLHRMLLSIELKDAQAQLSQVKNELRGLNANLALERIGPWGIYLVAPVSVPAPASPPAADPRVAAEVERAIQNDHTLLKLAQQRDEVEKQIRDILLVVANGDANPKVLELRGKLKGIDDSIANKKKELRPILEKEAALLRGAAAQSNAAQLQDRIAHAKKMEDTLQKEVDRINVETVNAGPGGKKTLDLDRYRIEVAAAEETYKRANLAVESLQVELKAPQRVMPLDKKDANAKKAMAILTHGNDVKRRSIASAAAGVSGLGLLLLGIAFLEFRARKIQSTDDVIAGTGLRVVGTLPALPARRSRLAGAEADAYWRNLMSESVDAIRTLLLYTARKEDLRVVMVTSAVGGEGKTSLSSHLAASLARAGRKTVLVDCDLRKPAAHKMFDLEQKPGFSELLRGEATLAEAVQQTQADTLSVLTAGSCDAAALQALAHGAAGPVFQQLRGQYDFVVVDTAPVLPVADSLLIGEHVDAVVFSVLRDISRMPRVYAAYQRLAMLGIRMLGAVVNGTREDAYGANSYAYVEN